MSSSGTFASTLIDVDPLRKASLVSGDGSSSRRWRPRLLAISPVLRCPSIVPP